VSYSRRILTLAAIAVLFLLLLSACSSAAAPTQAPPTAASTAKTPTTLNVAAIFETTVDQPWVTSWLQTMDRLKAAKPHGLTITVDYSENVAPPDAVRVLRQYAQSGKYQVIWAHSSYSDSVGQLRSEFPDIAWVVSGSGNNPLGGNVFWVDVFLHEPSYLMGIIAGKMTKSNIVGAVASFPFPNVTVPVNAFIAGAKSVNPKVQSRVTYIQSWFDPTKGKEAATAQIAAGADMIFAERFGPFEAAKAKTGVLAFGHFVDQNSVAPDVVVTSDVARWDANAQYVIDAWWRHVTEGTPYTAPASRIQFSMKDGGSDIAPFYGFSDKLPKDVLDAVAKAKADILAGKLVVPYDESDPTQAK
jgi:basic membrane protein A and related proteins